MSYRMSQVSVVGQQCPGWSRREHRQSRSCALHAQGTEPERGRISRLFAGQSLPLRRAAAVRAAERYAHPYFRP